ncbi:MAG TPA: hypothetical protein DHV51_04755 [Opitutae bacterium]|nr:hypothetical protein [Opitutae bacterium]
MFKKVTEGRAIEIARASLYPNKDGICIGIDQKGCVHKTASVTNDNKYLSTKTILNARPTKRKAFFLSMKTA